MSERKLRKRDAKRDVWQEALAADQAGHLAQEVAQAPQMAFPLALFRKTRAFRDCFGHVRGILRERRAGYTLLALPAFRGREPLMRR